MARKPLHDYHYRHHPDTHDTQLLPHMYNYKRYGYLQYEYTQRRIDVIQQPAKSPHVFSFHASVVAAWAYGSKYQSPALVTV